MDRSDNNVEFKALASAEAWIELGNYDAAAEELNKLLPAIRSSMEFCKLWILIWAGRQSWSDVQEMSERLIEKAPDDPFGYAHLAESLHQRGRSGDAALFLCKGFNAVAPTDMPQYHYALARYRCAEGKIDVAEMELSLAFQLDPSLRTKADGDPELEPIWVRWCGES